MLGPWGLFIGKQFDFCRGQLSGDLLLVWSSPHVRSLREVRVDLCRKTPRNMFFLGGLEKPRIPDNNKNRNKTHTVRQGVDRGLTKHVPVCKISGYLSMKRREHLRLLCGKHAYFARLLVVNSQVSASDQPLAFTDNLVFDPSRTGFTPSPREARYIPGWYKFNDPSLARHEFMNECRLQNLLEWHIFGIVQTAMSSGRRVHSQFVSGGPRAGAS